MTRAVEAQDVEVLAALLAEFFEELADSVPDAFAPEAARIHAELYAKGGPELFARLAEDRTPQAVLLGRVLRRPARRPAAVLMIDAAYTVPARRAGGLMSGLLEEASAWCRTREIACMELSTPVGGPARAFWTKRGFGEEFVAMSRRVE